jgi:AraC family transcriptional activator of tynA and feaB
MRFAPDDDMIETLVTDRSLSEIGYACGFSDYTHFARRFRYRFSRAPGVHSVEGGGAEMG